MIPGIVVGDPKAESINDEVLMLSHTRDTYQVNAGQANKFFLTFNIFPVSPQKAILKRKPCFSVTLLLPTEGGKN
jgi:hypothetical protein